LLQEAFALATQTTFEGMHPITSDDDAKFTTLTTPKEHNKAKTSTR
jgi:hypothetical protein